MKRYIRVHGKWIDTLEEQKLQRIYYVIGDWVQCDDYSREIGFGVFSYSCGRLQAETDEKSEAV